MFFLFSPQIANSFELAINLKIFDKPSNQLQRTTGYVSVDDPTEIHSKVRLLTKGRKQICGGTRKVLVARENFLSGSFTGTCFGFRAIGKWSQTGQRVKFRWDFKGSWIETR